MSTRIFEWRPEGLQKYYDGIYEDTVSCGLWSCHIFHLWEKGRYFVWVEMHGFGQLWRKCASRSTAVESPYPSVELDCDGYEYHDLVESFIMWFLDGSGDTFCYKAPDGNDRTVKTQRRLP